MNLSLIKLIILFTSLSRKFDTIICNRCSSFRERIHDVICEIGKTCILESNPCYSSHRTSWSNAFTSSLVNKSHEDFYKLITPNRNSSLTVDQNNLVIHKLTENDLGLYLQLINQLIISIFNLRLSTPPRLSFKITEATCETDEICIIQSNSKKSPTTNWTILNTISSNNSNRAAFFTDDRNSYVMLHPSAADNGLYIELNSEMISSITNVIVRDNMVRLPIDESFHELSDKVKWEEWSQCFCTMNSTYKISYRTRSGHDNLNNYLMYGNCTSNCQITREKNTILDSKSFSTKYNTTYNINYTDNLSEKLNSKLEKGSLVKLVSTELKIVNDSLDIVRLDCGIKRTEENYELYAQIDVRWRHGNINYSLSGVLGYSNILIDNQHRLAVLNPKSRDTDAYYCYFNGKLRKIVYLKVAGSFLASFLKYLKFFWCIVIVVIMILINSLVWLKKRQ